MVEEYDLGDSNVFTTFQGKYHLIDNTQSVTTDVVMLTCVNDVQILGDFYLQNYTDNNVIAVLPEECRPSTVIDFPAVFNSSIVVLEINPAGEIRMMANGSGTLFTSAINFNISERWYA